MTRCFDLPDLYAGKMHALLFRNWKTRVKGRDWYDFEWYVRNEIPMSFKHFCDRSYLFGSINDIEISAETFKSLLREKIMNTNIDLMKLDVRPFIRNQQEMDIWSTDYFLQLAEMMKIK